MMVVIFFRFHWGENSDIHQDVPDLKVPTCDDQSLALTIFFALHNLEV